MTDVNAFKALSLAATIGVLVVTACTIQLRGGEDASSPPTAEQTTDADGSDLVRCRTVTSEDAAGYQHCQRVWAENRRHFFGRKDGVAVSGQRNPASGLTPTPKDQSRMPQGYPAVAMPEASKP
ncbi:conjugative transfer region protein TrbK [Bradyrhizobium sp. LM2.7]